MTFTFLLTPPVTWLQRIRLGRVPAVLIVTVMTLTLLGAIGWMVAQQLIDVANQLPRYRQNIRNKIDALHGPLGGTFSKASSSVDEISREINTATEKAPVPQTQAMSPAIATDKNGVALSRARQPRLFGVPEKPVRVEVIDPPLSGLQSLRRMLGPLLGPLSTAAIVLVFTIFMLIKREDLRNRLLRLIGHGRLNTATVALDDAAQRISSYLLMQLTVNAIFGVLFATGLYFIGVPNAILWGAIAGLARFIPYIGTWIAGALPILLALAVFDGWHLPMLTVGLFASLELLTANFVEPWLYGAHTGVSSLAVLIAAVFWTMLWGPVGLILSTPLTACLVVLGRYVPQLEFLNVMLGDEPVLAPEAHFYQRLLALDDDEARTVAETYLKDQNLTSLYDQVVVPALAMAEHDRHRGVLDETRERFILQSVGELVGELAVYEPTLESRRMAGVRILCFPASDETDEITAAMLAQLLERDGFPALSFPYSPGSMAIVEQMAPSAGDILCICALPPFALIQTRSFCKQVRLQFPGVRIVAGIWKEGGEITKAEERLGKGYADMIATTLAGALEAVHTLAEVKPEVVAEQEESVK